jgi:hypothetical protein
LLIIKICHPIYSKARAKVIFFEYYGDILAQV